MGGSMRNAERGGGIRRATPLKYRRYTRRIDAIDGNRIESRYLIFFQHYEAMLSLHKSTRRHTLSSISRKATDCTQSPILQRSCSMERVFACVLQGFRRGEAGAFPYLDLDVVAVLHAHP